MIYHRHLRDAIVDVLTYLHPQIRLSRKAVELMVLTYASEGYMVSTGTMLKQLGGGPARGIFQIEPTTEVDIHLNYLAFDKQKTLRGKVKALETPQHTFDLELNIAYQIAIARLVYWRKPQAIPNVGYSGEKYGTKIVSDRSVERLAEYWKRHYNTYKGKGTVHKAVKLYREFTK